MIRQGGILVSALLAIAIIMFPIIPNSAISLLWSALVIAAFSAFSAFVESVRLDDLEKEERDRAFEAYILEQNNALRKAGWSDAEIKIMEEARRSIYSDRRV